MTQRWSAQDHGHWEGTVFVFDEPIIFFVEGQPRAMSQLDLAHVTLEDGIELDDVIHALVNLQDVRPCHG